MGVKFTTWLSASKLPCACAGTANIIICTIYGYTIQGQLTATVEATTCSGCSGYEYTVTYDSDDLPSGVESLATSAITGILCEGCVTDWVREEIQKGAINPDGWLDPFEEWVYDSATTISVPDGATLRYSKGDKIKLTQGGVLKYFYIVDVADDLLTILGGSDYTLLNADIEDNYYSHVASPVGFPQIFNWDPTYTGFSVDPELTCTFSLQGRRMALTVGISDGGVGGTSNSTQFKLTAPAPAADDANPHYVGAGQGHDAGGYEGGVFAEIVAGSNLVVLSLDGGATGWTNSGVKDATFQLGYDI